MSRWTEIKRDLGFAAGILRRRPFSVLIQVTNRCNMHCDFCDFWPNGVAPEQELSLEDYGRLEQELSGLGRFLISIEGGEPFLRPDLVDIVRILSRRHVTVLYTNGWYVDEGSARALFDAGLAQVGVSIDYADPARHDAKRGPAGTSDRAWRALELLRDAAPHGGRQVHAMTVYMDENRGDLEPLLQRSAPLGVGHCITLLSTKGFRRSAGGAWPGEPVSAELLRLWKRYPHFRVFRNYLELMDPFLAGGAMPRCRAGLQSFNIDHVGNVSPCIEKIDRIAGNVRQESLQAIHARLAGLDEIKTCQDCWTLCRGFSQTMGAGGSTAAWMDMAARMRSS